MSQAAGESRLTSVFFFIFETASTTVFYGANKKYLADGVSLLQYHPVVNGVQAH